MIKCLLYFRDGNNPQTEVKVEEVEGEGQNMEARKDNSAVPGHVTKQPAKGKDGIEKRKFSNYPKGDEFSFERLKV